MKFALNNKRYILKAAINLYSIAFNVRPFFSGEIDQIENNGKCSDKQISLFCNSFLEFFLNNNSKKFIELIDSFNGGNKNRIEFFKKCCFEEIERIDNHNYPLLFYWNDYFDYLNNKNFLKIINVAKRRTENYFKERPQYSVEQLKQIICEVFKKNINVLTNIKKIILYGSLAKGTNTYYSDIDLYIVFKKHDPLNGLLTKVFSEEFNIVSGQLPDCNYLVEGQSNPFYEWILNYGMQVYNDF